MLYLEEEEQISLDIRLGNFIFYFSATSQVKGMVFN